MFPRHTVFVIGAGASCELGLPSGDDLRSQLTSILQHEPHLLSFTNENLNQAVQELCSRAAGTNWTSAFQTYADAARRLRSGLPLALSIDTYLDAHRADAEMNQLGKLCIAEAILNAERHSGLYDQANAGQGVRGIEPVVSAVGKSWYLPLMRLLTSGKPKDDISTLFRNVAFIVFNYDRCLEHFLVNAIVSYYHVAPDAAIECVRDLKIVHPYGQVGNLPWQGGDVTAAFGDTNVRLSDIAAKIQTFTETTASGVAAEVKTLMRNAETLVFMGFGYLPQNMELLTVEKKASVRRVFATTAGISDSDVPVVVDQISKVIRREEAGVHNVMTSEGQKFDAFPERGYCADLMKNHWLRLTRPHED